MKTAVPTPWGTIKRMNANDFIAQVAWIAGLIVFLIVVCGGIILCMLARSIRDADREHMADMASEAGVPDNYDSQA
jgi:hypothetical protein